MPIWIEPVSAELFNNRSKDTLATHLGIQFTEIGSDYVKATMPVDHRTKQPIGLLNGGASAALAETVGSTAANYCVNQKESYCVGLEISANHVRPATEGYVTAVAVPMHLGNQTHLWEIKIYDDQEKLICVSKLTMMVIKRK